MTSLRSLKEKMMFRVLRHAEIRTFIPFMVMRGSGSGDFKESHAQMV